MNHVSVAPYPDARRGRATASPGGCSRRKQYGTATPPLTRIALPQRIELGVAPLCQGRIIRMHADHERLCGACYRPRV